MLLLTLDVGGDTMFLVHTGYGRGTCGPRVVQIRNRSQSFLKSAPAASQARSSRNKQRGGMHCRADNMTSKGRQEFA